MRFLNEFFTVKLCLFISFVGLAFTNKDFRLNGIFAQIFFGNFSALNSTVVHIGVLPLNISQLLANGIFAILFGNVSAPTNSPPSIYTTILPIDIPNSGINSTTGFRNYTINPPSPPPPTKSPSLNVSQTQLAGASTTLSPYNSTIIGNVSLSGNYSANSTSATNYSSRPESATSPFPNSTQINFSNSSGISSKIPVTSAQNYTTKMPAVVDTENTSIGLPSTVGPSSTVGPPSTVGPLSTTASGTPGLTTTSSVLKTSPNIPDRPSSTGILYSTTVVPYNPTSTTKSSNSPVDSPSQFAFGSTAVPFKIRKMPEGKTE